MMTYAYKRQCGISLIELMIGTVVGLVAVGGAIQAFVTASQSQRYTDAISILNENGRFAMLYLKNDLRVAGDNGCPAWIVRDTNSTVIGTVSQSYVSNVREQSGAQAWFTHFYRGVEGYEGSPGFLDGLSASDDSDVLVVHKVDASESFGIASHLGSTLTTDQEHGFTNGDPLFLTAPDCSQTALFMMRNGEGTNNIGHGSGAASGTTFSNCNAGLSGQAINCDAPPSVELYRENSLVSRVSSTGYFVNDTTNTLERLIAGDQESQTLVDGVDFLQIHYGLDSNDDGVANRYLLASEIVDDDQWVDIVTVQISLLLRSNDTVLEDDEIVENRMCGDKIYPQTQHLRSCFTSRINIRNRGGVRI